MAGQFGIAWVCGYPIQFRYLPNVLKHPKGSFERRGWAMVFSDDQTMYDRMMQRAHDAGAALAKKYNERIWRAILGDAEPDLFANPDEARR